MQGLTRRGLLYSNSTISAAVGRLVAVRLQQLFSNDPLKKCIRVFFYETNFDLQLYLYSHGYRKSRARLYIL